VIPVALLNEGEALVLGLLKEQVTMYVGICTSQPGEDDTLTTITELNDSGYSRKPVTFGAVSIDANGTYISNSATIEFGPFAGEHTIRYYFITNAASGTNGSLIFGGAFTQSKQVGENDTLVIPVGNLKLYAS
jgi:hypothetical protein